MPKANATGAGDAGTPFTLPADLSSQTVEQIAELLTAANAEMDTLLATKDPAHLGRLGELSAARKTLKTRSTELAAEQAEIDAQFQAYAEELSDSGDGTEGENGEDGDGGDGAGDDEPVVIEGEVVAPTQTPAPQTVAASARPTGGARTGARDLGGVNGPRHSLNPSLSGARSLAPPQEAPRQELAITASTGLPGQFEAGARISSIQQLGQLAEQRVRNMGDAGGRYNARRSGDPYGGVQIASIANQYETFIPANANPDVVYAYQEKVRRQASAGQMEAMVAAGGWCAPLMPRYDFFNIACEDGMIDLPTFGAERGGVLFPVSPSLADTFSPALPWYTAFSNETVPWLWTNEDDILAVTGSPTKPCIRVPCSDMTPIQLECYGICLTAGNLADNAWPESTRNFLRLLMAAHYHAQNGRYISQISALAVQVTGCTAAGSGAAAPILATAELAAIDYRNKYGMCDTDVIEWVFPRWVRGPMRADLAKRTGVDLLNVTDADIARWFDTRGIRVQFVADYQVRAGGQPGAATPITQYPSFVRGLMYAAGTVVRGNGMTLDLGVVRDSTLNATNDFTAAWMEECHLIAQFGHEVREYTINICPDGTTGAADLTSCCP